MKGMNKKSRGRSFTGVVNYLMDHDDPEIVGASINTVTAKTMIREFSIVADQRGDIYKPVWHDALSLPAGEHLKNEEWNDLARDYLTRMGFKDGAQFVLIKHNKTNQEHVHIVANRIHPDGSVFLGQNENLKSTRIIAELEKKHGLQITKGVDEDSGLVAKASKNEIEKALRTGQAPARLLLQQVIDEALNDSPDLHDFTERLFIAGVTVKPNIASTGRVNGLAFDLNGITFSGSKLGKKYAWNQLQKQIDYKPHRDNSLLKNLKEVAQKNDEIRSSQQTSQDAISINAKAREDSERIGISNGRHHKSVKAGIVSTQTGCTNVSAQSKQVKPKVKQIHRDTGGHFSTSSRNDYNSLIHVKKRDINMQNEIEIKRKKRHRQQEELLIITGKKRNDLDSEKFVEEHKKFRKTLELAFEKRENGWYSKHNGMLAFTEMDDKIIGGEGLMNKDGTYNEAAMRAMKQAAQLKFGDTFHSTGPAEYVRESWFATAKIGCLNTGYEPQTSDLDRLIDELKNHEEKYGKPIYLHPVILKQLSDHKKQLEFTKQRIKTASGGKSEAESKADTKRVLNQKAMATVNIGSMVDRFRNKHEQRNEHENRNGFKHK